MHHSIHAVCDIVTQDSGLNFLKAIRDMYLERKVSDLTDEESEHFNQQALKLGLAISNTSHPTGFSLSAPGYLVGNIAKEYCNWIDSDRIMPPPRPPQELIAGKDVLDLGCSIGRWLWEFQPHAKSVTGLELRREYIEIGKALAKREKITPPIIVHGCIEDLDHIFSAESTDFIFCRLAINHVPIRKALQNMVALLKNNGILWLGVESFQCGLGKVRENPSLKGRAFNSFGIINSLICELLNRQLNFRYRGRHQSSHRVAYPSRRWWLSTFASLGLKGNIINSPDNTFCIWGKKNSL